MVHIDVSFYLSQQKLWFKYDHHGTARIWTPCNGWNSRPITREQQVQARIQIPKTKKDIL